MSKLPSGWKIVKIGEVAQSSSKTYSGEALPPVLSVTKHKGFMLSSDYFDRRVFSQNLEKYKLVNKGEFAYATIHLDEGSIDVLRNHSQGLISPMYTVFKAVNINSDFLIRLLKSDLYIQKYSTLGQGSIDRRMSIPFSTLAELEIVYPPAVEQERIAEILASVDRLIELTTMKIDKLKALKKGIMQELLTKGIGHTKFKDSPVGMIPESWEYDLIDNVTNRRSGHTPDKEVLDYWNGNIQWISLADSSRLDNLHISKSERYITKKGIENSSAVLMPAGVVVMTRDAGIGKSAISLNETTVSQHFMAWECSEKKLNNYFLYYQLQYLKPVFEAEATGTTIKTIGLPFFKKFKICVPPIGEQIKIKDSLLSVDKNIFSLTEKLNSLNYTKKGLISDLLTGKVRVKV